MARFETPPSPIDTSCLDNWVDPDTLDTEASDLKSHGSDFKTAITDAKSSWQGLSTCFTAPGDASLYAALDTPATKASNVSTATSNISSAITTFASTVRSLEPERNSLIAEAASLNSLISQANQNLCDSSPISPPMSDENLLCRPNSAPFPPSLGGLPSNPDLSSRAASLNNRLSALTERYKNAVDTCVSSLNNLNDDGTQGSPPNAGEKFSSMMYQEEGLALYEALKIKYLGNWKNLSITIMGKTFRPPKFAINFSNWKTAAKESAKAAAKSVAGKSNALSTVGKVLSKTASKVSGVGTALSAALTYNDEYNAADKKAKETNPGLSNKERESQVQETAAVRTTGQVATTTAVTAGVHAAIEMAIVGGTAGSVAPGVGTAIGLAVGVAAGLATMIPTGDGKNVGDRIGDASEAVWSGAKKAGSSIKNAFKKIF